MAVIFHAIRRQPGVSQADLRTLTPIDRSTISTVVHQLESDGLLRRSRGKASYGMGRPEDVLHIEPEAGLLIGIAKALDNRLRLSAAQLDGRVLDTVVSDESCPPGALVALTQTMLTRLLERLGLAGLQIRGAGLLVAGPRRLDSDQSGEAAPIDAASRAGLEDLLGRTVNTTTDVHAFAMAERHLGAAGSLDNFIYVHMDAQVRGALVLDGRLHQGLSGRTQRFGHMIVEPNGRTAEAGGRGALNAYLSREAVLERLGEFGRRFRTLDEASAAAAANDGLVRTVFSETGSYLGVALANTLNLLDIGTVVLGGDLVGLSKHLMPAIRDMIARDVAGALGRNAVVRPSQLGADPLSAGAVALAMESFLPMA